MAKPGDAQIWIENQELFSEVDLRTKNETGVFSYLWTMFETWSIDYLSQKSPDVETKENNGNRKTLARALIKNLVDVLPDNIVSALDDEFNFFKKRFFDENGNEKSTWSGALFRDSDRADEIKALLLSSNPTDKQKAEAVLRLVYRLRNNLFHGYKWSYRLKGQLENFVNANSALTKVLEEIQPK